jgi:predicted RNase H-related nuclease YkuK (DUF458 family)
MYKRKIDINEVVEFVNNCSSETKIYIGVDSERLRVDGVWYADYITAVVVHLDSKHGCKIFGAVERERDWEQRANRPKMRLMNEVHRAADLYLELSKHIAHDIEVHLDINPNELYASSVAVNEAVGYIKGMCNVIPMIKPDAFAATCCADRFKEIAGNRRAA